MTDTKHRIDQFVHTLSYGDAISSEVLMLQRCLREMGYSSDVFAINVHPRYEKTAYKYKDFQSAGCDEVILHYSLGSPLNDVYAQLTSVKRTLIYHNITPARWFQGINPRIMTDIEHGLRDLPGLCKLSNRLLADSKFNARELKNLGFESDVLELSVDPTRWDTQPNQGILSLLGGDDSLHLLHVGRVAPNKKIEDILRTFYFLHHHVNPKSKLWLVGIDIDTELYSFALKRMAIDLRIDHAVTFTGGLTDGEVRAFYEAASVYLCMSEHEGFCLPVVEAMHFGLPVIAYGEGAIPETVGAGGIILGEKNAPATAELIQKLYTDQSLRAALKEAGKKRADSLDLSAFRIQVKDFFPEPSAINISSSRAAHQ